MNNDIPPGIQNALSSLTPERINTYIVQIVFSTNEAMNMTVQALSATAALLKAVANVSDIPLEIIVVQLQKQNKSNLILPNNLNIPRG